MRIIHPEPGFTGSASGIEFVNGTAERSSVSDEFRAVLTAHGFTFESEKPAPKTVAASKGKAKA